MRIWLLAGLLVAGTSLFLGPGVDRAAEEQALDRIGQEVKLSGPWTEKQQEKLYTTWSHRAQKRYLILTAPPGATVNVNGRAIEGKTPILLPHELGDPKTMSVERPGYQRLEADIGSDLMIHRLQRSPTSMALQFSPVLLGLGLALFGLKPKRVQEEPVEAEPEVSEADRFGDYVRGKLLGTGSMGEVFRATCGGRTYALKLLLQEWSNTEEFRERFLRESDICKKLDHPNIISVHAHGEKDGRLWMILDFVDGQSLEEWSEARNVNEAQFVALGCKLCEALTHAHGLEIVHRDLKPENILLDQKTGEPVITDFGLARGQHYETITKTDTTLGTPAFMAPEQIRGESGSSADLYSLGCVFYQLLCGEPPFVGDPIPVIMAQMGKAPTPIAERCPEVSPGLAEVVMKLLEKDPEDRYQSAEEVRVALKSCL